MSYKEYENKRKNNYIKSLDQHRKNKIINKCMDLRKNDFKFIDNMSFNQTILIGILTLGILILSNSIVSIYGNFYGNKIESIIWASIFESLSLGIIITFIFIFVGDVVRRRYGYLGCVKIVVVVSLIRGAFELIGSGIISFMPGISRMLFILAILVPQVMIYYIFKNKNILDSKKAILLILLLTVFI